MWAKQGALFEANGGLPRVPRRKNLMHVCDAGNCEDASCVQFECRRCKHRSEWVRGLTVTEAKRGQPCPKCNSK